MNFQDAIVAHLKWKDRLKQVIAGKETLDPLVVGKDDQCDLGRWIHGEGKAQFARKPHYEEVCTAHAHFHKTAADVIRTVKSGDQAKAQTMMAYGGAYYSASSACVNAITRLRNEVQ
jgi:hypothetical protein